MNLRLRPALSREIEQELARVIAFYGVNSSKYIRERDPEILKVAIKRSSLLLLEDETGALQGCCAQIMHDDGVFSETGAVRILVNGFGLQAVMMGIVAINEFIFSPPSQDIYAITAADNGASIKNIERAGFESAAPNEAAVRASGYGTQFPNEKRYFRFSRNRIQIKTIGDRLANLAETGRLAKDGNELSIEVEHPLFLPRNFSLLKGL